MGNTPQAVERIEFGWVGNSGVIEPCKGANDIDWHSLAKKMHFNGDDLDKIAKEVQRLYFPDMRLKRLKDNRVRPFVNRLREKETTDKQNAGTPDKGSFTLNKDGSIVSERVISLRDGDEMTPEYILQAHGLNASKWEVVSYRNNFWNSQKTGGILQVSYQSRLTAKPIKGGIDLEEVDKHFAKLDRQNFTPPAIRRRQGSLMAELNLADIHAGKLCWKGDTPENYDYKIARDVFYQIVGEVCDELRHKPIEYILFVWSNDFFNSDNDEKTTTAGTPQDTDVREKKLFNVGCEMLVRGVEMLSEIAPVKTFYTPSNHDMVTGYHALKYMEAWFRKDPNVQINIDAYPRKYELYGNTLLGFCHGDKEESRGTKERASRLASLMPIEASNLWGKARYREMHTAHLHSEHMIQEINGVIVRRISSPTALDTYHTTHGYMGAVRKAQVFLYDKERGLVHTINTPVA